MNLLLQIFLLLTFWTYHYEFPSTVLCTTDILHLSLWSSFHSSVCIGHSVSVIMKILPQFDVLLTFCISHYEAPSTALCHTDILYRALRRSFQNTVCFWIFVPVIMKLLPQPYVLLASCTCYFEAISTTLCVTDIMYMSLWSFFQMSVCHWRSVPVIMKLLPQLNMLLTFCTCNYEAPFKFLCATDVRYRRYKALTTG